MTVDTGIAPIGQVPWGSHFCHFYRDAEDLVETLVPFFKTGLESNHACLWVTAEPFDKQDAYAQLRLYCNDLERRERAGQLAIFDHEEWYERQKNVPPAAIAGVWLAAKDKALQQGYAGMRVSGNSAFLRSENWDDFNRYETAVRDSFGQQQIIALCSYQANRWGADHVLDVINSHDFALARRRGVWELIESASVKKTKDALAALNAQLERRVEERTQALNDALAHQTTLTAELSHRVKNTIATVQSIVEQTLSTLDATRDARTIIAGRLAALGRAHDLLSVGHWTGVSLAHIVENAVAPFNARVQLDVAEQMLRARAALDLSLILHELMTNACKFGALSNSTGKVSVSALPAGPDAFIIEWRERGGPPVSKPSRAGFGSRLVQNLVQHDLRGEVELAFHPDGLVCTMRIPTPELAARSVHCPHCAASGSTRN